MAQPLGRSAGAVAALVVADALAATRSAEFPVARPAGANCQTRLTWTDPQASLLVRLLEANLDTDLDPGHDIPITIELGDDRTPMMPWSITLNDTGIALTYHDPQAAGAAVMLHRVANRARSTLRHLAAPGQSARWTDPWPHPDQLTTPPATEILQRWRARQSEEARLAASFLTRWLRLDKLPAAGMNPHHWWDRVGLAPHVHPLLNSWCRWLGEHGFLTMTEGLIQPGNHLPSHTTPPDDDPVANLAALLARHEPLIRKVLTGVEPTAALLRIPDLRPGRLAAAEPELMPVWQEIGDQLANLTNELPSPLTLADLGGATVENQHLARTVQQFSCATTVLPAGRPHRAEPFDAVLAVGSLHRWPDPTEAVRTAAGLLRPGGVLIALENTELSPLGMLIAGLLENGFTDASGHPIDSPTQQEEVWLGLLNSVGMQATSSSVGPTPAVLIHARLVGSPIRTEDELGSDTGPIHPGLETEVARLWAKHLQTAPTCRSDSFFELGGDSLRATRFIAAVQQRYGITLAMRELFARPQLAAVAQRINEAIDTNGIDAHEEGVL